MEKKRVNCLNIIYSLNNVLERYLPLEDNCNIIYLETITPYLLISTLKCTYFINNTKTMHGNINALNRLIRLAISHI